MLEIFSVAAMVSVTTAAVNYGILKTLVNGTVLKVERIEKKVDVIATDLAYLKGSLDKNEQKS